MRQAHARTVRRFSNSCFALFVFSIISSCTEEWRWSSGCCWVCWPQRLSLVKVCLVFVELIWLLVTGALKMQDMKLQDMHRQSRKLAQKRQTSDWVAFYAYSCYNSRIVEDHSTLNLSHRLEHTRNSLIDVTTQRVHQRRRWRRRTATSLGITCCSDWDDFHVSGDTGSSSRQLLRGVFARATRRRRTCAVRPRAFLRFLCRQNRRYFVLQFHVLQFHALHIGPSFSRLAISCLANSSKIGPSISCPAISCLAILMVRHFHILHFQSTPSNDCSLLFVCSERLISLVHQIHVLLRVPHFCLFRNGSCSIWCHLVGKHHKLKESTVCLQKICWQTKLSELKVI